MKAVVLLGGEGTRLRPLTYTTPKQLLPVVEVPMLERVVDHLASHDVDEVVLSLGYRPDAFVAAYPDAAVGKTAVTYAREPHPLDTAGAIAFAARVARIRETFLAVNGDVLTDLDVTALVRFHRDRGATATIHLTAVDDPSRFGVVPTDDDGRVLAFVEKPPPGEAPTNLINAGTYVLEPSVVERVPDGARMSIERQVFPDMAAEGEVYAWPSDAYWLDTGTPTAYLKAQADLLDGTRPGPPAPGAQPLGDGVWVLGSPVIEGEVRASSLIADGATVGADAVVADTVVGARCHVAPGACVEGSVLLPGARVESDAVVIGSILGHDCVVEQGCRVLPVTVVADGVAVPPGSRLDDARFPADMAL